MKINKKYIIWSVLLSSFLIFCYVTLLPHDKGYVMKFSANAKNVNAVKSESNNSTDDFENLYSFSVKINNEVLQVPMSLSDFMDAGWVSVNEIGSDPFEFVPIEHTEFVKNEVKANVMIESTEVYPSTMDTYYVSTLLFTEELYKNDRVELPKNIILASSDRETIIKAYGAPDDIRNYEDEPERLFYKYDKNQMISLSLNKQGVLSEIMIIYEKPKVGLNFSSISAVQTYPEQLPATFNGDMFMLDDVIYNLPDKASRLLDNGWVPLTDEEFVADGPNEKALIDFQKGDQIINVELRNPSDQPSLTKDCYVVSVSFDVNTSDRFRFAGGFDSSSTLDDFRRLALDFQVKEVHIDMQGDVMVAFRIKTGNSSQFEVLMDYDDQTKIRGYRISKYPK